MAAESRGVPGVGPARAKTTRAWLRASIPESLLSFAAVASARGPPMRRLSRAIGGLARTESQPRTACRCLSWRSPSAWAAAAASEGTQGESSARRLASRRCALGEVVVADREAPSHQQCRVGESPARAWRALPTTLVLARLRRATRVPVAGRPRRLTAEPAARRSDDARLECSRSASPLAISLVWRSCRPSPVWSASRPRATTPVASTTLTTGAPWRSNRTVQHHGWRRQADPSARAGVPSSSRRRARKMQTHA